MRWAVLLLMAAVAGEMACSSYSSAPTPPVTLTGRWLLVPSVSTCTCDDFLMQVTEASNGSLDGTWRIGTGGVASDSGVVAGMDSATVFTIELNGSWGNKVGTATKTSASRLRLDVNSDVLVLARQ